MPTNHPLLEIILAVVSVCGLSWTACGCEDLELQAARQRAEALLAAANEPPPDLGKIAYRHVEKIVAMGERYPGSPGWQQQIDYIQAELQRIGLEPTIDSWTDPTYEIPLKNLSAKIPGRSPHRLLLACHHDTKHTHGHELEEQNFVFVGANDGASGVGLLLALAEHYAARAARARAQTPATTAFLPTIEFVFFDGEEARCFDWDRSKALFGSKRYAKRYAEQSKAGAPAAKSRIRAMVLLDMVGAADLTIDHDTFSDEELRKIIAEAAERRGHAEHFFAESMAIADDHLPFIDRGIPAIDLIDFIDNPQWHTPDDTLEHIRAGSMQKVGEVVWTALPAIAARYFKEPEAPTKKSGRGAGRR